ncbi:DUF84 family protein, partial [Candidatus Woesearchaeota archaeon]|nr:DUF84 family protein [Candidatus Woesearchaeota archaeon]
MILGIGSKNPTKSEAVRLAFTRFGVPVSCIPKDVNSEVSHQPMTMQETIQGAMSRAKCAYEQCDLSVGLESGLIEVPQAPGGYMAICACAIYHNKRFSLGISPSFCL